jgi:hypothetical protein
LFDYFYHDLVELVEFFFEVVLELELSLVVFVVLVLELRYDLVVVSNTVGFATTICCISFGCITTNYPSKRNIQYRSCIAKKLCLGSNSLELG